MYYLGMLAMVGSLALWMSMSIVVFGLPFVAAHGLVYWVATRAKQPKLRLALVPPLVTALFCALAALIMRLCWPYGDTIQALVQPFPWFGAHAASSAGVFIIMLFFVVAVLVLAVLVYWHASGLPAVFFQTRAGAIKRNGNLMSEYSRLFDPAGAMVVLVALRLALSRLLPHYYSSSTSVFAAVEVVATVYLVCLMIVYYVQGSSPRVAAFLAGSTAVLGGVHVVRETNYVLREGIALLNVSSAVLRLVPLLVPLTVIWCAYQSRDSRATLSPPLCPSGTLLRAVLLANLLTPALLIGQLLPVEALRLGGLAMLAVLLLCLLAVGAGGKVVAMLLGSLCRERQKSGTSLRTAWQTVSDLYPLSGARFTALVALLVLPLMRLDWATGVWLQETFDTSTMVTIFYLVVAPVFHISSFAVRQIPRIFGAG